MEMNNKKFLLLSFTNNDLKIKCKEDLQMAWHEYRKKPGEDFYLRKW
jgi:hypothetical protein